jgi:hypothetical protein
MTDMMYCPSCGGEIILLKGVIVTLADEVHYRVEFKMMAQCTNCPVISEVDPDRGALVDLRLSMAVLFERQQPRPAMDYGLLRGRKDS